MWKSMSPPFRNFFAFCMGVLAVMLLAFSMNASAVERTAGYELSTTNCAGETVDISFYDRLEVYVDVVPIPASGVPCPTDPAQVDTPPSPESTVAVGTGSLSMTGGQVTLNLMSGLTYYARARACNTNDECSQFSNEMIYDIPLSAPNAPLLIQISAP